MKYTIEISIAGCSTNCAHCYVDGGFAPYMSFENYKICIEKLKPLLKFLGNSASVTLGNELFCNPYIDEILEYNITQLGDHFSYSSYYVPTTGIALLARKDKEKILELLKKCGAKGFMLALHGDEGVHNSIVNNSIAYKKLFETEKFVSKYGFDVLFNIIVSKKLLNNFEKTLSCVQETQKSARLTIPVFVPTNRMRKYQSIRADVSDCLKIAKISDRIGIDTLNLIKHCNEHTELAVKDLICSGKYDYLKDKEYSPKWVFVNVTRDLNVYYGNVGAHTEYIGNLKELSEAQLIDSICKLSSNYDYTSYFSDETFLKIDGLIHSVNADDKVYPSVPDCLYSLLDKAGVKNLII